MSESDKGEEQNIINPNPKIGNITVNDAKINDLLNRASETILRERSQNKLLNDKISKVKKELLLLYKLLCSRPNLKNACKEGDENTSHIKQIITRTIKIVDESFTQEQQIDKISEKEYTNETIERTENEIEEKEVYSGKREQCTTIEKINNANAKHENIMENNSEKEMINSCEGKLKINTEPKFSKEKEESDDEVLNNYCNADMEENKQVRDRNRSLNSNLTMQMVKRLERSLAPTPKQEYVSEIIKAMLTEFEKDVNEILQKRNKVMNIQYENEHIDHRSIHKTNIRCGESTQMSEKFKRTISGVNAQKIHFVKILPCRYKLQITKKFGSNEMKTLKNTNVYKEKHEKDVEEYILNMAICNGKLSVKTGGGHVDIIEYLQRKLQL